MRNTPLLVIFITIFIDMIGIGIIIPVLPVYADLLGADSSVIGMMVACFPLAQFLFAPFWGKLSDRIGRKPVLLASIFLTAISYIILANAVSMELLFISRTLAGIGAANISAANAYISDITPPEKRAKNYGIIGAALGLGFILGPPIGGPLMTNYGIEAVGYVPAGLAFANLILAYYILPESLKVKSTEKFSLRNPLSEIINVWPRKLLFYLLLINFIFMAAFSMIQVTATLMWSQHFKLNAEEIAYTFAFMGVMIAIMQGALVGRLTIWLGEKKLFIGGHLLMAAGLVVLPIVSPENFIPWELLALTSMALGTALFNPTIASILSQAAEKEEQGKMMGLLQSVGSLSRVGGLSFGGFLYGLQFQLPFFFSGVLMIVTAIMSYRVVRRRMKD